MRLDDYGQEWMTMDESGLLYETGWPVVRMGENA